MSAISFFSFCKYIYLPRCARSVFPFDPRFPHKKKPIFWTEEIRLHAFGVIFAATLSYLEKSTDSRKAITCGHVRVEPTIKSNGFRFAWGEKVFLSRENVAAGSGEVLASIQRTYERTCRHRRSYIEISAKETKARGTTREKQFREKHRAAPARSLPVFVNRRRALCVSENDFRYTYLPTYCYRSFWPSRSKSVFQNIIHKTFLFNSPTLRPPSSICYPGIFI